MSETRPTRNTMSSPAGTEPPSAADPASSAAPARPRPEFIGIVYLGLNPDATAEWKVLWEANKDRGVAKLIGDSSAPDVLELNGSRYDLTAEAGVWALVGTLGLEPAVAEGVARLILDQFEDARDEVAHLCFVYAQAERGERRMERVVLSGHSSGDVLWGDDNGLILFQTFERLAELFPDAAGQVRDLMISACYTGGERQMEQYRRMFPNLESIWAYAGSSPGTWSGAQDHLRIWEEATEESTPADLSPDLAAGTRKGDRVAIWTKEQGYVGGEPLSILEAELRVVEGEPVFQRYFAGEEEVADTQTGPLRDYYGDVQRLLAHPLVDPARVVELERRRDVTLRLLFYGLVRQRFASSYAPQLTAGYAQAGMALPDYASLSRGAALRGIGVFGAGAKRAGEAALEARSLLERGLRDLDPALIPSNWI